MLTFRKDFLEEVIMLDMEVAAFQYIMMGGGRGMPNRSESRSKVKEMESPGYM